MKTSLPNIFKAKLIAMLAEIFKREICNMLSPIIFIHQSKAKRPTPITIF